MGRKKKSSNNYFRQEHEDAIVEYCLTEDYEKRNKIYTEIIDPCLDELIDKLVATYKFQHIPNINDLKHECKLYIIEILHKFDPSKNKKAFSYFTVCVRNWFYGAHDKNKKRKERFRFIDDESCHKTVHQMQSFDAYHAKRDSKEFVEFFRERFQQHEKLNMTENETKVYEAILKLLDNETIVEVVKKQALKIYISEMTFLTSREVDQHIKTFGVAFNTIMKDWINGRF